MELHDSALRDSPVVRVRSSSVAQPGDSSPDDLDLSPYGSPAEQALDDCSVVPPAADRCERQVPPDDWVPRDLVLPLADCSAGLRAVDLSRHDSRLTPDDSPVEREPADCSAAPRAADRCERQVPPDDLVRRDLVLPLGDCSAVLARADSLRSDARSRRDDFQVQLQVEPVFPRSLGDR
jgi:hypothetical protein